MASRAPRRWRGWAARASLAGLGMLALTSCSQSPGDLVAVRLHEFAITLVPAGAEAGRIRFEIDNDGERVHNLVLVRASDPSALKLTKAGNVDLVAHPVVEEIDMLEPGSYVATSPNILPDDYLLICTLTTPANGKRLAHFKQGMWAKLTVEADPSAIADDIDS